MPYFGQKQPSTSVSRICQVWDQDLGTRVYICVNLTFSQCGSVSDSDRFGWRRWHALLLMRLIFTIFQMESCSHKREVVKKTSCGNNCSFRECDNNRNDLHKTEIGKSSLLLNSCYSLVGVELIWNKRSISNFPNFRQISNK